MSWTGGRAPPAQNSARLAQDLIRLPKFAVLPLKGLDALQRLGLRVRRNAKLGRKQTRCRSIPAGAPTAAQRAPQGRGPRQVGCLHPEALQPRVAPCAAQRREIAG
jgi:hypothetical protein